MRTIFFGVMACLLTVGCASARPQVGASCHVQFKRDLLGSASQQPIPPTTDSMNGAQVSVSGKLVDLNADWVVLDIGDNQEIWVQRKNVLLLHFKSAKTR